MEMAENALIKDKKLSTLEPFVNDSGEGRWSAIEAMEKSVPFVVNTYALHARYISRDKDSFAFRMLAAIRNEFGGHEVKKK
jgi:6-phosphogluconate dehydrogenase